MFDVVFFFSNCRVDNRNVNSMFMYVVLLQDHVCFLIIGNGRCTDTVGCYFNCPCKDSVIRVGWPSPAMQGSFDHQPITWRIWFVAYFSRHIPKEDPWPIGINFRNPLSGLKRNIITMNDGFSDNLSVMSRDLPWMSPLNISKRSWKHKHLGPLWGQCLGPPKQNCVCRGIPAYPPHFPKFKKRLSLNFG